MGLRKSQSKLNLAEKTAFVDALFEHHVSRLVREQSLELEIVVVVDSNVEHDAGGRRSIEVEPLCRVEVDEATAEAVPVKGRHLERLRAQRRRRAEERDDERQQARGCGFQLPFVYSRTDAAAVLADTWISMLKFQNLL